MRLARCKFVFYGDFSRFSAGVIDSASFPSFVCATSKETTDTVCLTSYRSPRGRSHLLESARIWEVCRATSAATSFFDPIAIGPFLEKFVDGALGRNNPIYALWTRMSDSHPFCVPKVMIPSFLFSFGIAGLSPSCS